MARKNNIKTILTMLMELNVNNKAELIALLNHRNFSFKFVWEALDALNAKTDVKMVVRLSEKESTVIINDSGIGVAYCFGPPAFIDKDVLYRLIDNAIVVSINDTNYENDKEFLYQWINDDSAVAHP